MLLHRLSKVLIFLNFFKTPVRLKINREDFYSSRSSELFSLVVIAFLLFNLSTNDIWYKKSPKTLERSLPIPKYPYFNISVNNFLFMTQVGNQFWVGFPLNKKVFTFVATIQAVQLNTSQGAQIKKFEKFELVPCNLSPYYGQYKQLIDNYPNVLCLPITEFQIGGSFSETTIDFLTIELILCKNTTENNNFCESKEVIDKFFSNKYFEYLITDNQIDISNYNTPIYTVHPPRWYYIEPKVRKNFLLYLDQVKVTTDNGFFFESNFEQFGFKLGLESTDFDFETKETLYRMVIMSSNIEKNYSRSYMKIQEALASLGGIMNFLIFSGFLLLKLLPFEGIVLPLANSLFSFISSKKIAEEEDIKPLDVGIKPSTSEPQRLKSTLMNLESEKGDFNLKLFELGNKTIQNTDIQEKKNEGEKISPLIGDLDQEYFDPIK